MEEWLYCCVGAGRKETNHNGSSPAKPRPGSNENLNGSANGAFGSKKMSSPNMSPAEQPALVPPALRMMHELPSYYDVNFTPSGELGRGHFAKVYRGKHRATGVKVAAKRILRSGSKTETLHNEIKALARLSHPNIVRLYDVFYDDVYVVLILEYLGGGELFGRIIKGGAYSERDAAKHFRDLAGAIAYMHAHNIVHRDLKPENLVLAEPRMESVIKISDFGLSKIIDAEPDGMVTVCGTRAYSAPEINFGGDPSKKGKRYTAKVDVWSMGVILYVILGAYHPFDPYGTYDNDEIWLRITRGQWDFKDKVWESVSTDAKDLLSNMMCVDPVKRLSMEQVLQHPWLQKLEGLPTVNLSSVKNPMLRNKMGSDVDSQTHFSTQTANNSYGKNTTTGASMEMEIVDEEDDAMQEVKVDADMALS